MIRPVPPSATEFGASGKVITGIAAILAPQWGVLSETTESVRIRNFHRDEQDFSVGDPGIWRLQQAMASELVETTELKAKMLLFDLLLCQWETPA